MTKDEQRDIGCMVLLAAALIAIAVIGLLGWTGLLIIGLVCAAIAALMMAAEKVGK